MTRKQNRTKKAIIAVTTATLIFASGSSADVVQEKEFKVTKKSAGFYYNTLVSKYSKSIIKATSQIQIATAVVGPYPQFHLA